MAGRHVARPRSSWRSRRGEAAIKLAVHHSCTSLLAQPPVQAFLTREWRGPLLQDAIEDDSVTKQARGDEVVVVVVVEHSASGMPCAHSVRERYSHPCLVSREWRASE
eukprot:5389282-Prymnesium_polylepis.1